uniref:C-type lectin domain-containing protein n=1 Tax=Terrapene triunguis TaxID=2587831 RepID=A0A674IHP9_9SAUR
RHLTVATSCTIAFFEEDNAVLCWLNMTSLYCSLFQGDKCSSCPEGWIQHRRKCYHFTHERSSWQKSREYCSSHSSRLLRIENKEELVGNLPFALFSCIFQTTPSCSQTGFHKQTGVFSLDWTILYGSCYKLDVGGWHSSFH